MPTSETYAVYGLGNALVDVQYEVDNDFLIRNGITKGGVTLVEADRQYELISLLDGLEAHRSSGGSAANTLLAVAGFGERAYYSCKIADDEPGQFFVHELIAAGVNTNAAQHQSSGKSGCCLVFITPDAERTMNTYLGVSGSLMPTNVNEEALVNSQFLYMEGHLCASDSARSALMTAHELARSARVHSVATFSDPSVPRHFAPQLQEVFGPHVDHLFCNEEEMQLWTGEPCETTAIAALKDFAGTFAVTCGAAGSLVWDGRTLHRLPAETVKAVDTLGAGDLYAGAYLYALVKGASHRTAGELANRAAARLVIQRGPRLSAAVLRELMIAT